MEELLNAKQIGKFLQVTPRTVKRWSKKHKWTVNKFSHKDVRYLKEEVVKSLNLTKLEEVPKDPLENIEPLMAKKEVCEVLKCSVYILDRLHNLGLLPKIQIFPRYVRYRRSDVLKLIERRTLW